MPGLIMRGVEVELPGVVVHNWKDMPKLRLNLREDGAKRRPNTWIRSIVLHTTLGIPGGKDTRKQVLHQGVGPATGTATNINQWWSTNGTSAGAHLIVDFDGTIYCLADLVDEMTYHATSVNGISIGVEIAQQQNDAGLWESQLHAVLMLCNFLTQVLGIQRQVHLPYSGMISRMSKGGLDVVGVYGHRDQTVDRGFGDPGDFPLRWLQQEGHYEAFDFGKKEDVIIWQERQRDLNLISDGIPGPLTVQTLKNTGYKDGIWTNGKDVGSAQV